MRGIYLKYAKTKLPNLVIYIYVTKLFIYVYLLKSEDEGGGLLKHPAYNITKAELLT